MLLVKLLKLHYNGYDFLQCGDMEELQWPGFLVAVSLHQPTRCLQGPICFLTGMSLSNGGWKAQWSDNKSRLKKNTYTLWHFFDIVSRQHTFSDCHDNYHITTRCKTDFCILYMIQNFCRWRRTGTEIFWWGWSCWSVWERHAYYRS